MNVSFTNQNELIEFLLEQYTEQKQFESWYCIKFELDCDKLLVNANTTYYDFGTKMIMRFGNFNQNPYSSFYKIETQYSGEKIKYQYLSEPNINIPKQLETYFLKDIFTNFVNKYKYFSFDIKLKYPDDLKKTFDPNDEYESFCIDFFSDGNKHDIFFTYNEKIKDANITSAIDWTTFCYNKYLQFLEDKKNSVIF